MFGGSAHDSAIGVPRVPLDELYALPAARFVEQHGGEVRTNARARIACDGSRVRGVDVRGERIDAGAVICAVPWHAFGRTLEPMPAPLAETAARAEAMADSPIVTVNLWLDRPVTDVPFVGLPGRVMQWVFDKRQAFGEDASHLALVSSGASAVVGWTNEALVELATREVREGLPAARGAVVRRAMVVREKRATFSLAPGQPKRPSQKTGIDGLVLAGDWTDTRLPATIEGAALSGHRAAALVRSLRRV
jgi:zeta-carotene desaturase